MGSLFRRRKKDRKGRVRESPIWQIQYYRNGKKFRESSNSTRKADAERLLREREGLIARGLPVNPRIDKCKIDELIEEALRHYRIRGYSSCPDAERRWRLHLEPVFGGWKASEIKQPQIDYYVEKRQGENAAPATVNRELALLRFSVNRGHKLGKLSQPARIEFLREDNARSGFFSDEQIERVIQELPKNLRPMIRFAFLSGWRIRSEILPLEWRQVDFAEGSVRLDAGKTKNRKPRLFPMTSEIRQLLENQRVVTDAVQRGRGTVIRWVFHRDGERIRSFYGSWRSACRRAGCPGRIPHDLRRTAVRNMIKSGIPERIAMKLTGHETRTIFARYHIIAEEDLQLAVEKLDSHSSLTQSRS